MVSGGQVTTGGVVSTTVMSTVSVSCSRPSETVRVTVVVPMGNWPVGVAEWLSSKVIPVALQV